MIWVKMVFFKCFVKELGFGGSKN